VHDETAHDRPPRVSIGLAVYNGEDFLDEAITSLLAQTFTDFELIISDNASTDRTEEICRKHEAVDPRVRYFRNAENIGGVNNENRTFQLARGEYFRLAAHDDVCEPELLQRCVDVLDERPDVVLCHTAMVSIDADGNRIGVRYGEEGTAPRPHQRFRQLSYRFYPCEATYGLVRSDVMATTRLQQNYTGSDRVLLCELALHGPFFLVREELFRKRFHDGNRYQDWRGRMAWFFPDLAAHPKPTFPNWLQLIDYVVTIGRVRLPLTERLMCLVWTGKWTIAHAKGLGWDVVQAARMMLHGRAWRRRQYAEENWL
jgi:glycosyltransferase involved in cell wall biosynthesis